MLQAVAAGSHLQNKTGARHRTSRGSDVTALANLPVCAAHDRLRDLHRPALERGIRARGGRPYASQQAQPR